MPRKIPTKKEPKKPQKFQRPIWLTKKQIDGLDRLARKKGVSRQIVMSWSIDHCLVDRYFSGGDAPRD